MKWSNFILSDKKIDRFARHLVFWFIWWLYFTAVYFHYQQIGQQQILFEKWNAPLLIKSTTLVLLHIFTCYCFINFLLPPFLLKSKYVLFMTGILLLCALIVPNSYLLHKNFFSVVDAAFQYKALNSQNIWWTTISASILSSPQVIAAATFIKLIKRWYLKQKEKEQLEQEKLKADLQLLKAQIHPEFLFSSLDSLYIFSKTDSFRAAHLLLKLSDLLSYTLYECNKQLVALDKEITLIKDYLAVVKTQVGNRMEMDISVKGETNNKMISPLLLLPFVENSFSKCGNDGDEKWWLNIELRVEQRNLTMKLINGNTGEMEPDAANENGLANVKKRLALLYPNQYELKTTTEQDMMVTFLKINLSLPSEYEREAIMN
jgi:two-component system LytT family sensor kinase